MRRHFAADSRHSSPSWVQLQIEPQQLRLQIDQTVDPVNWLTGGGHQHRDGGARPGDVDLFEHFVYKPSRQISLRRRLGR